MALPWLQLTNAIKDYYYIYIFLTECNIIVSGCNKNMLNGMKG